MARSTMTEIIATLRQWTAADAVEYSDNALERIIDTWRIDVYRELMRPLIDPAPEGAVYLEYRYKMPFMERHTGSEAIWRIEDAVGRVVPITSYVVNYDSRTVTFVATTEGATYYLTGRAYDLHRAAAEVWRSKMASVANRFDVKTDNHDLKRSQLIEQYEKMARMYESRAPARSVVRVRADADR